MLVSLVPFLQRYRFSKTLKQKEYAVLTFFFWLKVCGSNFYLKHCKQNIFVWTIRFHPFILPMFWSFTILPCKNEKLLCKLLELLSFWKSVIITDWTKGNIRKLPCWIYKNKWSLKYYVKEVVLLFFWDKEWILITILVFVSLKSLSFSLLGCLVLTFEYVVAPANTNKYITFSELISLVSLYAFSQKKLGIFIVPMIIRSLLINKTKGNDMNNDSAKEKWNCRN